MLLIPKFAQVNDHAFLADDTLIGCYELGGGWIRVEHVKIGKRAFVGNSGMAAAGRKVPKASLVAVLSAAPRRSMAKAGSSWLGSPPTKLRRPSGDADSSRTYDPPRGCRCCAASSRPAGWCRCWSACCSTSPWAGRCWRSCCGTRLAASLLGGPVMIAGGLAAALVTVLAKWVLVGRHRPEEHPLWSGFVWRNELADTFTEVLAAPWFASVTQGTVALNVWLRMLGRARSATACGATPTGCPSPTWSSFATAAPSTTAASSRPTSSTTGCCRWTGWSCTRARRSDPTA